MSKERKLAAGELVIGPSDIGRHVFTLPDIFCDGARDWLESPNYDVDTEAIILVDLETKMLARTYVRTIRVSDDYGFLAKAVAIAEDERLFATQELANQAALEDEREYATNILRACEQWEKHTGGNNE